MRGARYPLTLAVQAHLAGEQLTADMNLSIPYVSWGLTVCGKTLPSCHPERSEGSRSSYFQGNARFFVACGSSE
jgi:hypothetical protein